MAVTDGLEGITDDDVALVLDLLSGSDVEELEVEVGSARLRVRRIPGDRSRRPRLAGPPSESVGGRPALTEVPVVSALVGVYHSASRLDGIADVKEGDTVSTGQTLGVIEAMGMLSSVEAPASGVVVKVMVRDGQPVEYGQTLMVLRPSEGT